MRSPGLAHVDSIWCLARTSGEDTQLAVAGDICEHRSDLRVALDPAVDRALIDQDPALSHPFADLGVAQPKADVPADSQRDDIVVEGAIRERRCRATGETAGALATAETLAAELGWFRPW